jgi:acetate kinase
VGAYKAAQGGIDAIAFAGGIGENAPVIRRRTLSGLEGLGIDLAAEANEAARGREAEITGAGGRVRVFVVPTNEEILIARDTLHIVSGKTPS